MEEDRKLTFGCDPETAMIGGGGAIHNGYDYDMDKPLEHGCVELETMEEILATTDVLVVGHSDNGLASIQAALDAKTARPKCILVEPTCCFPYKIQPRRADPCEKFPFKNHMQLWTKGK